MKQLTLNLKTVTPLFLGGANPEIDTEPELREPSIKGCLRFWYRAVHPNYTRDNEERIFGSTDSQSGLLLRITDRPQAITTGKKGDPFDKHTAYLGYGAILYNKDSKKSEAERPYFKEGSTFTLTLLFKPSLSDDDRKEVEKALWAWIMFGGLGARSRRGFGSLMVEDAPKDIVDTSLVWRFADITTLKAAIDSFINSFKNITDKPSVLPEYTCFSNESQCVVLLPTDGEKPLKYIGKEMMDYRSYKSDEKNFKGDHDIMFYYLHKNIEPTSCPKRASFGLPHNYFFSSSKRNGSVNLMEDGKDGRRASPLFIHIQGLTNGQFAIVATYLPAVFLSNGKKVKISTKPLDCNDFSAVEGFMKRLKKLRESS